MSFRDISEILREADRAKEAGQQQAQQELLSSQAYELFSTGVSPVTVAIKLNLRSSQVIMFQKEYWELKALHDLNQIYAEIKFDPWPLVNLYRSIKAAGMGIPHVITLLKVANNDLPGVEQRYNSLKQEVTSL